MRYQLSSSGWVIGATLISGGTQINLNKDDVELMPFESLAKGLVPPADSVALDADCAVAMRIAYPHLHKKLHRRLGKYAEALYQQIISDPLLLAYYRPKAKPLTTPEPKFDLATALDGAIQRQQTNSSASGRGQPGEK